MNGLVKVFLNNDGEIIGSYSCNNGFELLGVQNRTCQSQSQQWSGSEPMCTKSQQWSGSEPMYTKTGKLNISQLQCNFTVLKLFFLRLDSAYINKPSYTI